MRPGVSDETKIHEADLILLFKQIGRNMKAQMNVTTPGSMVTLHRPPPPALDPVTGKLVEGGLAEQVGVFNRYLPKVECSDKFGRGMQKHCRR